MWLLLGLVFLTFASCDEYLRIPIVRHKSGLEKMLEVNTHPDHLMEVFGRNQYYPSVKPTPKPHDNDTVTLFKVMQSQFFGEIQIGHPGQVFKMAMDTTYSHSWVTSALCSPFAYPPCALRNKYDSSKSSTYVDIGKKFVIDTNKGKLIGFVSMDKVHLGHINVVNQTFAEIEEVTLMQLLYTSYDGVIGLAYSYKAGDPITPIFLNIYSQKLISKPIFSFYFNRDQTTQKGGSLLLGGVDAKHINGSFTYLAADVNWFFKMDKVWINYHLPYKNETPSACDNGCTAFPSTSDVLISGPRDDIKRINRLFAAHYVPYLDRYVVSCEKVSKFPSVTFVLGGKNFTIFGKDYVQKVTYGPAILCLSAFSELRGYGQNNLWSLGVSFLGRYYMTLNLEKKTVGFARASSPL